MGQATLQTWEETTKRLPNTQNILCGGLFHSECVQNDTEIKLEIPTWKRFYSWNHTELFQINFEAQGKKKKVSRRVQITFFCYQGSLRQKAICLC